VGASRPRKVRARVIAASNQPLDELVEAKGFRADLYYRLARLHLRLPPLRERLEDLPLLVRHFLQRSFDYGQVAVGEDLLRALAGHSWPATCASCRTSSSASCCSPEGSRCSAPGSSRASRRRPRPLP